MGGGLSASNWNQTVGQKACVSMVPATGEIRASELQRQQLQCNHRSEDLCVHGARNSNKYKCSSECMIASKYQAGLASKWVKQTGSQDRGGMVPKGETTGRLAY